MKKRYTETPLVNEYLQSIAGMKAAETDPFFYTRLKAKMEKKSLAIPRKENFKLAFAICILSIFLSINCWILLHQQTLQKSQSNITEQKSFAEMYSIDNSLSY